MTSLELAQQALADDVKATPGPWSVPPEFHSPPADQGSYEEQVAIAGPPNNGIDSLQTFIIGTIVYDGVHLCARPADTAFIAAARTREPVLAQAVVDLTMTIDRALDAIFPACPGGGDVRLDGDDYGTLVGKIRKLVRTYSVTLDALEERTAERDELLDARDHWGNLAQERHDVIEELRADLAAMTAARDEACDLIAYYALTPKDPDVNVELRTRYDALRAVGAKKEETK